MKYAKLPLEYKQLAHKRMIEQWPDLVAEKSDTVSDLFVFCFTREGQDFWRKVHEAKSKKDLPEIPEEK